MKELPKALYNALLDGLTMLLTLRLSGTPSADTITATAQTWSRALAHGKQWDEARDLARFQTAFMRLAAESRYWPTPKDFADKLPPPPELLKLESPRPTAEEIARGKAHLERMRQGIARVLNSKRIPKNQPLERKPK